MHFTFGVNSNYLILYGSENIYNELKIRNVVYRFSNYHPTT